MGVGRVVIAVAASVSLVAALTAMPASARPSVTSSWRARPEAVSVAVDKHGRVYTVANIERPMKRAVVLRAYRADGSFRWQRVWRPRDSRVFALDVAVGPGGIVLVTGSIQQCESIWGWGWALRAWGPDGQVLWQRAQRGWRRCEVSATQGNAVTAAADTVAMVARRSDEYSAAARILTFDIDGHRRWRRWFRLPESENEFVHDVAVGRGGGVYLAATARVSVFDEPETDTDAVLTKLRADGKVAWRRFAPDRRLDDQTDGDHGTGVALGTNGAYFSAVLDEPDGPARAWIARYSKGGSLTWARFVEHWRYALVATWAGGLVLAGTERDTDGHGSHVALRGFDDEGRQRWRLRVGPESGKFWGVSGFDAGGRHLAAVGSPARQHDWSRVWVLAG